MAGKTFRAWVGKDLDGYHLAHYPWSFEDFCTHKSLHVESEERDYITGAMCSKRFPKVSGIKLKDLQEVEVEITIKKIGKARKVTKELGE
jgi:hypothetical protein